MCLSFGKPFLDSISENVVGKVRIYEVARLWRRRERGAVLEFSFFLFFLFVIYIGRLERNKQEWGWGRDVDGARAQLGFAMFPSLGDVTCLNFTTMGFKCPLECNDVNVDEWHKY